MTTKMTAALGALALTLTTASAVLAQDIHQISIVNGYAAPVEIYAEDAGGGLHALTRLKAGEVKTLEADVRTVGWNRARLHVRPTDGADWLSTWRDRGIVTDNLRMSDGDTLIFWIAPILDESTVEIHAG